MIFAMADLHIGAALRKRDPEFRDDSIQTLDKATDRMIEMAGGRPFALLLPGDVFDKDHVSGDSIQAFRKFVDRIEEAGGEVHAIEGNHDRQPNGTPLTAALGSRVLSHERPTIVQGLRVCGVSYMPPERLREILPIIPDCDILLLHAPMKSLLGFESASGLLESEIPIGARCTIIGDVHVHRTLRTPLGAPIHSPGPLHPCKIDEPFDTGFLVIDPSSLEATLEPVVYRELVQLNLSEAESDEEIESMLTETIENLPDVGSGVKPVLHVRATHLQEKDIARIRRRVDGLAVVIETVGSKNALTGLRPRASTLERALTWQEALDMVVDAENDPEVHSLINTLLSASDPELALTDWHKGLEERCRTGKQLLA